MKIFQCSVCQQTVFFENSCCLSCGSTLGFLPDRAQLAALAPPTGADWHPADDSSAVYRKCQNYISHETCNWMVPASDPDPFCRSCRLNRTIPDLRMEGNRERWYRLEVAKRRLVFQLLEVGLPIVAMKEDARVGLSFDFLVPTSNHVLTGYADGVITINAVEADDVAREKLRVDMNEPYRTLLGHFRHESAHHYWAVLLQWGPWLEPYRQQFGDERQDYQAALSRHYAEGPIPDWLEQGYISSYASVHPWEDWAETWAHYMHVIDTLQTSQEFGLALSGDRRLQLRPDSFQEMLQDWHKLTFAINSINRSMGVSDLYPFVLSSRAKEKLEFVHRFITDVT